MQVSAAISLRSSTRSAVREVVAEVADGLGGEPPDLAFFFISRHHAPQMEEAFSQAAATSGARHFLGCSASGVLAAGTEAEDRPSLCLWAAILPGTDLASFEIQLEQTPEGQAFSGLPTLPEGPSTLVLLGEPYSFPVGGFLDRLRVDHPEVQVVGGMASSARSPGENRLFVRDRIAVDGAVGVSIGGRSAVRPLVTQGCRPFGKAFVATRARDHELIELGGAPALERLETEVGLLSDHERSLLSLGLHVGRALDASRVSSAEGDFLVRGVNAIHRERGTIEVSEPVRVGQTIRFHLRDPHAAGEDLRLLLEEAREEWSEPPAGGLLVACAGRGSRLFGREGHDSRRVLEVFDGLPLAGFFAAGELGPLGPRSYRHGVSAVLALFGG